MGICKFANADALGYQRTSGQILRLITEAAERQTQGRSTDRATRFSTAGRSQPESQVTSGYVDRALPGSSDATASGSMQWHSYEIEEL